MAQPPLGPADKVCPQHRKPMSKVCHKCPWWTLLRGKHPQTGADLDEWNCAIGFLPLLLIDGARSSRSTAAAVESLRNEVVQTTHKQMQVAIAIANHATLTPLLEG